MCIRIFRCHVSLTISIVHNYIYYYIRPKNTFLYKFFLNVIFNSRSYNNLLMWTYVELVRSCKKNLNYAINSKKIYKITLTESWE